MSVGPGTEGWGAYGGLGLRAGVHVEPGTEGWGAYGG